MANNNELERRGKKFGYKDTTGFQKIAFVLDDLGPSQTAFLAISEANKRVGSDVFLNISLFFLDCVPPCIEPLTARYNISDALGFDGVLIATSPRTAIAIKTFTRANRYFYINDMTILNNLEAINDILLDKSIVKVVKAKDYYTELTKRGYEIELTVVKDFNINTILEIINGKRNNQ